jgi:diadenosine tetraphosphatase ApaH/serine/threonine PP2A family protein phosphatase
VAEDERCARVFHGVQVDASGSVRRVDLEDRHARDCADLRNRVGAAGAGTAAGAEAVSAAVDTHTTALLYDIHGNLAALEAVLAEAAQVGATSYLLGGDYAAFGPWPRETAELLEGLPATARIRGNVDRWLREEPEVPADARPLVDAASAAAREALGPDLVARLYELPERAELEGILVCHGSPLSDIESFAPEAQPDEERLLAGENQGTILFGHSHQQFERPGPNGTFLVNPGSVGQPLDGDVRAAWAVYEDGEIGFRRTEYDVERAAARMRTYGEWAEPIAQRIERASGE